MCIICNYRSKTYRQKKLNWRIESVCFPSELKRNRPQKRQSASPAASPGVQGPFRESRVQSSSPRVQSKSPGSRCFSTQVLSPAKPLIRNFIAPGDDVLRMLPKTFECESAALLSVDKLVLPIGRGRLPLPSPPRSALACCLGVGRGAEDGHDLGCADHLVSAFHPQVQQAQSRNPFTPELKKCILPTFQKAIVWVK